MATYINYGEGEEDALVQGAQWLQKLVQLQQGEAGEKEFLEKFKVLEASSVEPTFDLFVDYAKDIFSAVPEHRTEKDVESFFAVLLSTLSAFEKMEDLDLATTRLCDLFSSSNVQQPELRLRLLMMLYNTFVEGFPYRYRVFKYTLDYAASAKLFDLVVPYLEYLDGWLVDWEPNMKSNDKRTLFRDISGYMRALGKRTDAFLYLKKHHELYKGAPAKELEDKTVQENTLLLLKDALQLPSVIQFDDILAFDTVTNFSKSSHAGKDLVKLCTLFFEGGVNEVKSFHEKNAKLFTENDISYDDTLSKIRLLTLATMVHGRSEITLAEIAEKLEGDEDSVEKVVVKALSENVIDGRIDQVSRKVLVKSAFQRKFEKGEWDFLDGKLNSWITNLESVIKFIGEQKSKGGA